MIFKIINQNNGKYLICCNFWKIIDILNIFKMFYSFIENSNDGDNFILEEIDENDEHYNDVLHKFKDDDNCFNNNFTHKFQL